MIILGLTGAIGSGKTTFGNFLDACAPTYTHLESSHLISEVANALRKQTSSFPSANDVAAINSWLTPLAAILGSSLHRDIRFSDVAITPELLKSNPELFTKLFTYLEQLAQAPRLRSDEITPSNKSEHRAFLQWLGGYLPYRLGGELWYQELVRRAAASGSALVTIGGVRYPADAACIRASKGKIIALERPGLAAADSEDITERERTQVLPDLTVLNNGTLEELRAVAATIWADLARGQAHSQYSAVPQA